MSSRSFSRTVRESWQRLPRLFRRPDSPADPYAYVMAPKKPRPPSRGAAVADEPEP